MPTYRNDGVVSYKVLNSNDVIETVAPGHSIRTFEDVSDLSDLVSTGDLPANEITIDQAPGAGLEIGTTKPNVANAAFQYNIAGVVYSKAANAVGTALSGDNIPTGQYGAWRLEINAAGAISVVEATGNATGYATAELAAAGLPAVTSGAVSMGVVTASKSDGAFAPGTTDLDAANTTVAYTDGDCGGLFTDPVKASKDKGFLNYSVFGAAWSATVVLQRSFDSGVSWVGYDSFSANKQGTITDFEDGVLFRLGIPHGDYNSGSVALRLSK